MNPSKIRKKKENRGIYTKEENKLILYLISQGALTQKDLVLMLYPKEIKKEIIKKDYFICECGEKNFISKKGIWNKCKKCNSSKKRNISTDEEYKSDSKSIDKTIRNKGIKKRLEKLKKDNIIYSNGNGKGALYDIRYNKIVAVMAVELIMKNVKEEERVVKLASNEHLREFYNNEITKNLIRNFFNRNYVKDKILYGISYSNFLDDFMTSLGKIDIKEINKISNNFEDESFIKGLKIFHGLCNLEYLQKNNSECLKTLLIENLNKRMISERTKEVKRLSKNLIKEYHKNLTYLYEI